MTQYSFAARKIIMLCALGSCMVACTSLLPRAGNESFYFDSFEQAQHAIESLVPMQSNEGDLSARNLDPDHQPNTIILSFADISKKFLGGGLLSKDDLGPGIIACLAARDACRGLELNISKIERKRTGGFFSDFINFRRRTETTGWRFNALILVVDGVVVYRSWGGQPEVNEIDNQRNPLGPFQDIGPAIIKPR